MYFPTILALLGHLRDSSPDEVDRRRVTYARWMRKGDANPVRFDGLTVELLRDLRATGSLFARKFSAGSVPVDEWSRLLALVDPISPCPERRADLSATYEEETTTSGGDCEGVIKACVESSASGDAELGGLQPTPGVLPKQRRSEDDDSTGDHIEKKFRK